MLSTFVLAPGGFVEIKIAEPEDRYPRWWEHRTADPSKSSWLARLALWSRGVADWETTA